MNTDKTLAWFTLLSGLSISAVSMYYSVVGLMLIFSAAALPIMLMGISLESGKIIATVWLKRNWDKCPILMRTYLIGAIVTLMAITSMGIYGFLSRAHSELGTDAKAAYSEVKRLDDQIARHQKVIDTSSKAIDQLDNAIEQLLARGSSEQSAKNAVYTRNTQRKERANLTQAITDAQEEINDLEAKKEPFLKVTNGYESEVGPIKYISALFYGEDVTTATMERAVRVVILMIVCVFDVFAVILLLASQYTFQSLNRKEEQPKEDCGCDKVVEEKIDDDLPPGENIVLTLDDAIRLDDSNYSSPAEIKEEEQGAAPVITDPKSTDDIQIITPLTFDQIDDMIASESGIPETEVIAASNTVRRKLSPSKGFPRKRN